MITSNSASQVDVPRYGATQTPNPGPEAEGNHSGRVVVSQFVSSSINSTPPPTCQKITRQSQDTFDDVSAHVDNESTKLINDTNQEQRHADECGGCGEALEACCILFCWMILMCIGS